MPLKHEPASLQELSNVNEMLGLLAGLREKIFAGDNTHCFIERQNVLGRFAPMIDEIPLQERHAIILEAVLAELSTPIEPEDVILGRMVEGPLPEGSSFINGFYGFSSNGHLTPDYPALLTKGLDAIALEAEETARRSGDEETQWFADSTVRCCKAITAFAKRYANSARQAAQEADGLQRTNLERAASALEIVPAKPAPDFFAALQSIWFMHFILSCVVGSRDFAFGRMDQYLLPLYEQGLADGTLTPDLARAYLAHFMLKTKEISGTTTDNYFPKPVPSQASNQYVIIGGRGVDEQDEANALSVLIPEAMELSRVPQPMLNVRLGKNASTEMKQAVAKILPVCQHQVQFWNDDLIIPTLQQMGVPDEEAFGYALTACNRINLPGIFDFIPGDVFHNMAHWLLIALDEGKDPITGDQVISGLQPARNMESFEDVLAAFEHVAEVSLENSVNERSTWMQGDPRCFYLESILLKDCVKRGRDLNNGGLRYRAQFHFFGGLATTANSLLAIHQLVFEEERFTLPEFLQIVADNFAGHEELQQEIMMQLPKFGNDDEVADQLACDVCNIALDALEATTNPHGYFLMPSIYSLYCHWGWGKALPATPDGRLQGEPISENESPTHGTDKQGITALMQSVARLPHKRTPAGGLNVKMAFKPDPETVMQLTESFFELGGVHVGYTFVDRKTLEDAQLNPTEYRSLCVRITGFSEYFIALSPEGQADIIGRTEY